MPRSLFLLAAGMALLWLGNEVTAAGYDFMGRVVWVVAAGFFVWMAMDMFAALNDLRGRWFG